MALGQSFEEIGMSCAYGCQCRSLRLRPWQSPPMFAHLHPEDRQLQALVEKMRAVGLSLYEPDPIAALEALKMPTAS
jgi:hypothetical protein